VGSEELALEVQGEGIAGNHCPGRLTPPTAVYRKKRGKGKVLQWCRVLKETRLPQGG